LLALLTFLLYSCSALRVGRLLLALLSCLLTLLTLAGPLESVDELSFFSGVFKHFSDTQPLVARQLVQ